MKLKVRAVPRCAAAAGLLLLALVLVLAAVVVPWQQRNRLYDDEIERLSGQLERYQGLIATIPGLRSQLRELQANRELDAYYLKGSDPSLAGVDLQRRIEAFVESSGGKLISIQILPPADQDSVYRIGVRVRMSGYPNHLSRLLYDLESGKPLLFVPSMSVRAPRKVARPRKGRRNDMLNINLDIHGYIRKEAA